MMTAGVIVMLRTLMSQSHLGLEILELFGMSSSGFGAHLFAGPLEGSVNLLCEMHVGCSRYRLLYQSQSDGLIRGVVLRRH
jgi:hypothetical protein